MQQLTAGYIWLVFGFIAQTMFFLRFFVQWLASEKRKQSVIPTSFWWLSLSGGIMLLVYSIYRKDPVFIVGQATGVFIYVRNLWFIHRGDKTANIRDNRDDAIP
jgi:lipid-A-disaccharide synthase-like uncharacterized protein